MRPILVHAISPAPAGDVELRRWNTPVAFLYGGLAILIGVIAVTLLLLACSCDKSPESTETEMEKSEKPAHALRPKMEPRVVVIMAGDTNPTYFAKPVAIPRSENEAV